MPDGDNTMEQKTAVLNDIHFPYHDSKVLHGVMDFIESLKVDRIVINGDMLDCANISSFVKDPMSPSSLTKELRHGRKFLEYCKGLAKEVVYIGGNHEDRIRRFIWKQADTFAPFGRTACGTAIDALSVPNLLGLEELGVPYVPFGEGVNLGHLLVTHGSIIRKHSGYTARAAFESTGTSVLIGHTHRLGTHYITNRAGEHAAYENGCLCSLKPGYMPGVPNWQQGFAIVHTGTSGWFCVEQPVILKRKWIIYGGKRVQI